MYLSWNTFTVSALESSSGASILGLKVQLLQIADSKGIPQ
jgi:hypothetical protein